MRFIILAIFTYLAVMLQVVVFPALNLSGWHFNFLVMLVASISFFCQPSTIIFWSFIIGALLDKLTAYSTNLNIFILPLAAWLGLILFKRLNPKPSPGVFLIFSGFFFLIYRLSFFLAEKVAYADTSFWNFLKENYLHFFSGLGITLAVNCLILAPLFYLVFKRLVELFDYWEQRRKG